jgi:hypothetical protein
MLSVLTAFIQHCDTFKDDILDENGKVAIPGSKMGIDNLVTCICPNILYSKSRDPVEDNSFACIRIIVTMIQHDAEIWKIPESIRDQVVRQKEASEDPHDSRTSEADTAKGVRLFIIT